MKDENCINVCKRQLQIIQSRVVRVNINGADQAGTIMNGADMTGAEVNGADLAGAEVNGADLAGLM